MQRVRPKAVRPALPGLLAGALGVAVLLGAEVSPYRFQEIFRDNSAAVVRLRSDTEHGPLFTSAFLVHSEGVLLTHSRAVTGASAVHVVDPSGASLVAEVLASNPALGVALLRAPSAGALPTLQIGSSAGLRKNDWVVGIGHDEQGQASARAGCVSRRLRARSRPGTPGARQLVIDLATSPGGPVLDLEGKVVAIALRPKGARRAVALAIDEVRPLLYQVTRSRPPRASN